MSIETKVAPDIKDALDTVNYIFENAALFQVDVQKIILSGFSSGANLAAVVSNLLRNTKATKVFHQLLISGAYDYTDSLHAYDAYALQDQMLNPNSAPLSFDCYCKKEQRKIPTCSPYWEEDLSGLPPTTIMVGEYDGGRSQSEGYAEKLRQAGNAVEVLVWKGQAHGTILYRKIFSDGQDPAVVAGIKIGSL